MAGDKKMRKIDWPPVWLLGCMALTWVIAWLFPGLAIAVPGQVLVGLVLIGIGVMISILAVQEMARAKTTVIPRRDPNALVTSGIFRLTRNPIYLSDWIMLLGWIVLWGAVLALPLLWVFPRIITKRFIEGEEEKMRAHFGDQFEAWAKRTRRWI